MDTDLEDLKKSLSTKFTPSAPPGVAPISHEGSSDITAMLSSITGEIQHLSRGVNKLQVTISDLKPSMELSTNINKIMQILGELQSQQETLKDEVRKIIGNLGYKK